MAEGCAACRKSLILLAVDSCTDVLGAMRIYAANIVSGVSLVDGRNKVESRDEACLSSPRAFSTTSTESFISSWDSIVSPKILGSLAKRRLLNTQHFREAEVFFKGQWGRRDVSSSCACRDLKMQRDHNLFFMLSIRFKFRSVQSFVLVQLPLEKPLIQSIPLPGIVQD